jgi:hypothetical protein
MLVVCKVHNPRLRRTIPWSTASFMNSEEAYAAGSLSARRAIANGVPRWLCLGGDRAFGQEIDPGTGLPLAGISGPAMLAVVNAALVLGYNDTISAGIKSGEVTVDFRPLLMSRSDLLRALEKNCLGILSTENPRIVAPNDALILQLRLPKRSAKRKFTWISFRNGNFETPEFLLFDSPVEVALGKNGKVLILKTSCVLLSHDVATTQVLNRYSLLERVFKFSLRGPSGVT